MNFTRWSLNVLSRGSLSHLLSLGMGSAEVEPNSSQQQIKFSDVEGVDEAKEDLEEVV